MPHPCPAPLGSAPLPPALAPRSLPISGPVVAGEEAAEAAEADGEGRLSVWLIAFDDPTPSCPGSGPGKALHDCWAEEKEVDGCP